MKYATWVIDFDGKYGTGPEPYIAEQGGQADGHFTEGNILEGARILGYFTGNPSDLEKWQFTELTQQEALDFALAVDNTASIAEDGRIIFKSEVL